MPYNLDLERRIDGLAARFGAITKKKMFGGVGYMLGDRMVFGIHKQALVIRTTPEKADGLLKIDKNVRPFDITGRPMKGWLLIASEGWQTDRQLLDLLNLAIN